MTLSLSSRISVPENVLFRELEGESVILNVDTETYFGLDDVGTRMWAVLTESESIGHAMDILAETYDVASDVLEMDLLALIETLVEKGLMEAVDASRVTDREKK